MEAEPTLRKGDAIGGSVAVAVVEASSGVTIDEVGFEGSKIEFRVTGGTAGAELTLRLTWQTGAAPVQTLEAEIPLLIV